MKAVDPMAAAAEIEGVLARLAESDESAAAVEARRLLHLVMSFYGAGLSRMLELLREERGGSEALLLRLAADPLVTSVLALHDLDARPAPRRLIQITRGSSAPGAQEEPRREDRCGLCHIPVNDGHAHLVDVESRRLLCACTMCSGVGGRYRVVPSRYVHRAGMTIAPAAWDAIGIPVGLAFFVINTHAGRTVASYPGPAGATESLLPMDAWPTLVREHPWLGALEPDVEALLVRRAGDEYRGYIVPVDACYALIGRIRKAWSGFSGGTKVEKEIDAFFDDVLSRAGRTTGASA